MFYQVTVKAIRGCRSAAVRSAAPAAPGRWPPRCTPGPAARAPRGVVALAGQTRATSGELPTASERLLLARMPRSCSKRSRKSSWVTRCASVPFCTRARSRAGHLLHLLAHADAVDRAPAASRFGRRPNGSRHRCRRALPFSEPGHGRAIGGHPLVLETGKPGQPVEVLGRATLLAVEAEVDGSSVVGIVGEQRFQERERLGLGNRWGGRGGARSGCGGRCGRAPWQANGPLAARQAQLRMGVGSRSQRAGRIVSHRRCIERGRRRSRRRLGGDDEARTPVGACRSRSSESHQLGHGSARAPRGSAFSRSPAFTAGPANPMPAPGRGVSPARCGTAASPSLCGSHPVC